MNYRDGDGKCLACSRTTPHLHTADEVQAWQRAVNRSMSKHPAGRRRGTLRPVESPER